MIHRRLIVDDGRGVGEALNETGQDSQGLKQFVRHYVLFEGDYRTVQKWNDQRILPSFAVSASNTFAKASIRRAYIIVPSSVKLYLRPFEDGSYLLRFHNINPTTKVILSICRQFLLFLMNGKSLSKRLQPISLLPTGRKNSLVGTKTKRCYLRETRRIRISSPRLLASLNMYLKKLVACSTLLASNSRKPTFKAKLTQSNFCHSN